MRYSFFFPVLPVLFFFIHNLNRFLDLMYSSGILLLFIIYSLLAILLYVLCRYLIKLSNSASQFLSTIIISCFLFYGGLQDFMVSINPFNFSSSSIFLVAVLTLATGVLLLMLKRKKIPVEKLNKFLKLVFLFLVSYELLLFTYKNVSGGSFRSNTSAILKPLPDVKSKPVIRPDIYFIVFDGYTNYEGLKEYWGYENEIYSFLDSMGFYTSKKAASNYAFTPFSIASILNLQYLPKAENYLQRINPNFYAGLHSYRENILFPFLKQHGYTISIHSLLDDKDMIRSLGILGPGTPVNWLRKQTLERIYLNPWIIHKIFHPQTGNPGVPDALRKNFEFIVDYNKSCSSHILDKCNELKTSRSLPVFSYTHFMLPHEPYVFDSAGNPRLNSIIPSWDKASYLAQVKYANSQVYRVINCLVADSTRQKIIIIQGDHGYRSYPPGNEQKEFKALSAFYFFDKNYYQLNDSFSHVNTFRVILNQYFSANLPLLKDSIVTGK